MPQQMPVVRQMQWMEFIPQFVAMAVLATFACIILPVSAVPIGILIAVLIYLTFCSLMRATIARDRTHEMRAYRAQKFHEAISHFEASYRFFSAHPRLDAWRSLLFGVASPNPDRIIALCNIAYCSSQVGNGQQAIKLYEQALQEKPDCVLAKVSLNMLRSVSSTPLG